MDIKKFSDWNEEPQNEGVKSTLASGLAALSMLISSCHDINPKDSEKIQNQIDTLKQETEKDTTATYKPEETQKRYIVTFRFRELYPQDPFSKIDFTFDIPVDKEYYDQCEIGQMVERDLRSFTDFNGGEVLVFDKKIQ